MYYKSKKISLSILFVTSVLCSLVAVSFFTMAEYKNIPSVIFMSLGIFALSALAYLINPSRIDFNDNSKIGGSDPTGLTTAVQAMGQMSTVALTGTRRISFIIGLQVIVAVAIFLYWN